MQTNLVQALLAMVVTIRGADKASLDVDRRCQYTSGQLARLALTAT
jgi:hypothetical protein